MSKAKAKTPTPKPKAKTPKAPKVKTPTPNAPKARTPTKRSKVKTPTTKRPRPAAKSIFWDLRLYVAGRTGKSVAALEHLQLLCEERFKGKYRLVIIDLIKHPELAKLDQIIAIPTLVRKLPPPIRKIIGDLSNTERVLLGLDLQCMNN